MDLNELKTKIREEHNRQRATPTGSPKTNRSAGGVMLILGITTTVINILSWMLAGRLFKLLLAANLVLVGAGMFMLITGKNPFAKLKR